MKTRRIELRADAEFCKKLDDLAREMQCGASSVVRRLVTSEHRRRFPDFAKTPVKVTPTAAATIPQVAPIALPTPERWLLDDPSSAAQLIREMGITDADIAAYGKPRRTG